ncbi:MAG TPA: sigma 54-interacting transcriptional regulator [Nitrospiria bacterium]|nr:sigma 54-interacting transcriptional regulator [Nitrospiria bacterium]
MSIKTAGDIDSEVILESINDGVLSIGLDKKINYVNRAAERLLGYKKEEIVGMSCAQVAGCDTSYECLLERTIKTGENLSNIECAIKDKAGKVIPVSINTAIIRGNDGEVIGGVEIFRDISQIKTLTEELKGRYLFDNIIGKNFRMQEIYDILPDVAKTKSTVLIEGESGTGKELIAHAVHHYSPRKDGPFVKVNCGALAEGILESELFGHVRGAFTGAISSRIGRFELANGGTIFLDEIGDISLSTQIRLLRVLQEEEFERVGDTKRIKVDVRVIAATNKDLKKAIERGDFRQDLYYRLRVVPIYLPRLRERKDDIPLLINFFLKRFNAEIGKRVNNISPMVMEILMNYDYPGNIRELENIIEHALILCQGNTILPEHLPGDIVHPENLVVDAALEEEEPLKAIERELFVKVLEQTGWNHKKASDRLKISRTTLWRKIKALGIEK